MLIKKITEIESSTSFGVVQKQGTFIEDVPTSTTIWYFIGIPFRKDIIRASKSKS